MSRLSDKINDAIASSNKHGVIDRHLAKKKVKPKLDDEDRDILIDEGLSVRITAMAKRAVKHAEKFAGQVATQIAMFPELHRGYPVDREGKEIKLTDALTRLEFKRIIQIRREQVEADQAHLKYLEHTEVTVAPIWDRSPDLTFGEVCAMYAAKIAA